MRGIMGLQQGRPIDPAQSDSAKAVWRDLDELRRPGAITRNLLKSAGHEFPEPTRREEWEREMRWLDYLDRQRGESPIEEDTLLKSLFRKLLGRASGGIIPGYEDGGTPSAVAQTYDYGVPQQTEQQWADLTDRVVDEGSREYTPYGGQRLAGFTQQEIAAQQATEAYSTGQGPQGTIDAQTSLQTAGQQQSTAGSLDPYMSQYTQNVTDPQLRQLAQFNQQQMQNIGSQAAGSGAFGGYRQGVMQQQQAMDTSQQGADIIGAGQQRAFENAQQALQADRQAALGAGQAQGALGAQQQAQQRQRNGDLGMVGQQRRGMQQKSLDIGYQDFQNRLNQERSNIDWQQQAMKNLPYRGGTTMQTFTPQPGDLPSAISTTKPPVSPPGSAGGGIIGPMYSQFLRRRG